MLADRAVIGTRLREAREKRRWSRAEMARRLRDVSRRELPHVSSLVHMIKEWESGKHCPNDQYRRLYETVLETTEDELFAEVQPAERSPSKVLAELLPAGELSERISRHGRVGQSAVADLAGRAHALRLADDVLAGGDLLVPAYRELEGAVRLHRDASHSEQTSRGLLTVIGELAQIAGWVASDAGQLERAAETYELGISAAREAGDGALESNLAGSLAYQTANTGDPSEAVRRSVAALNAVRPDGPPRARALAWDRLAWAQAKTGDAQATMRALGEAGDALAEHDGRPDPPYLYWVDSGELQVMEARAYTELGRPLRAVPLLVDVLSRYDATHTREVALYLSWLAVALADANEPEEAAATAARMLRLGTDVASARTTERAQVVLARLEPYRDVAEVKDVLRGAHEPCSGVSGENARNTMDLRSDMSIGDRLRIARRYAKLTQEGLAERSGVNVDTIRKLEQNQRENARISTANALANALDVDTSALLFGNASETTREEPQVGPMRAALAQMSTDSRRRIGVRLRSERLRRHMTVDDVAEDWRQLVSERERRRMPALQDLRRMIRGYEAGEHVPGPDRKMLYCAVFGLAEDDLFGR